MRERNIYNRSVQHLHESAEHDCNGDDPGINMLRILRCFLGHPDLEPFVEKTLSPASLKS
jgi:hypothetical protein